MRNRKKIPKWIRSYWTPKSPRAFIAALADGRPPRVRDVVFRKLPDERSGGEVAAAGGVGCVGAMGSVWGVVRVMGREELCVRGGKGRIRRRLNKLRLANTTKRLLQPKKRRIFSDDKGNNPI